MARLQLDRGGLVMYHFSPTTRQFYVQGIHRHIPDDAVSVAGELHAQFMAAQSRGDFNTIRNGQLIAIEPPTPEAAALAAAARRRRDAGLAGTDWTQLADSPLLKTQREAWKKYRQALRDIPQQKAFPTAIDWPKQPQ